MFSLLKEGCSGSSSDYSPCMSTDTSSVDKVRLFLIYLCIGAGGAVFLASPAYAQDVRRLSFGLAGVAVASSSLLVLLITLGATFYLGNSAPSSRRRWLGVWLQLVGLVAVWFYWSLGRDALASAGWSAWQGQCTSAVFGVFLVQSVRSYFLLRPVGFQDVIRVANERIDRGEPPPAGASEGLEIVLEASQDDFEQALISSDFDDD